MNWIEQKIIKLEKMISYVYCKVKNLINIHNNLEGLQGGQDGQYYHLTKDQYDYLIDSSSDSYMGKWVIQNGSSDGSGSIIT